MFTSVDKAIVALLMSAAFLLKEMGIDVPFLNEGFAAGIAAFLGPVLVYLIANKRA